MVQQQDDDAKRSGRLLRCLDAVVFPLRGCCGMAVYAVAQHLQAAYQDGVEADRHVMRGYEAHSGLVVDSVERLLGGPAARTDGHLRDRRRSAD